MCFSLIEIKIVIEARTTTQPTPNCITVIQTSCATQSNVVLLCYAGTAHTESSGPLLSLPPPHSATTQSDYC